MSSVSRDALNSLLPEGAAWEPEPEGDYDNLFEGIAENSDYVRDFLSNLSTIRNPLLTFLLPDLEKEYGITPLDSATEAERRQNLLVAKTSNDGNGSNDFLEAQLRASGFDVYVHDNDPPVDPDIFLSQNFAMVAAGGNAYAGRADAFAAIIGGELLVNGPQFAQSPDYDMVANGGFAYAGNSQAIAGHFAILRLDPVVYEVPDDSGYWGLIFFVGGPATRDVDGKLTDIERATVSILRKTEFQNLILRYKPLHSWAGLIIDYV